MDALVMVTGGSSGLGRALLATAPDGSRRVDISRSGPPPEADRHVPADLADPRSWARVGDAVDELVGSRPWDRVTLIHCAGTLEPVGFAGEVDADDYASNVLLNSAAGQVLGQRFLAAVAPSAARRELALVSSGAASSVYPGWSAYCAAKAAADHWVRTVGEEQTIRGDVRVLAVAPGVVATGMQELIRDVDVRDFPRVEKFHDLHETGALSDPFDVAGQFWELLADDAVPTGSVIDLRQR